MFSVAIALLALWHNHVSCSRVMTNNVRIVTPKIPCVVLVNSNTYIAIHIYKYKNIFTKMLKDVGMEVPKSIETRSKYLKKNTMHADKGRGR